MSIYKRIRSFIGNHKSLNRVYTFFSVKIYGNMVVRIKQHRLQKYASELLFKFNRALSLAGCDYWLDYGTLLGAIREKGLIGHDLDLDNLGYFASNIPDLLEVSIGHALISDALYLGLEKTIGRYLDALRYSIIDRNTLL